MAPEQRAAAAAPDTCHRRILSAHLEGCVEEVLLRHRRARSLVDSKREDADRAQSAGALDSAPWHNRTASSAGSDPLPLRRAEYAHLPGSRMACEATPKQREDRSDLSRDGGACLAHCRSTSVGGETDGDSVTSRRELEAGREVVKRRVMIQNRCSSMVVVLCFGCKTKVTSCDWSKKTLKKMKPFEISLN